MSNIKISIIIPTYNREKMIGRTIESVINQTFSNWELLIIDDGSTDNTKELVKEYLLKDHRIKYFHQKNSGGPASPRNIGLKESDGEYIAFLDSDDEWIPEKLEKQLEIFNNSKDKNLGIVGCFCYIKNNKGDVLEKRIYTKDYKNHIRDIVKGCFIISPSTILTKASIIKEVGNFDTDIGQSDDWEMWIKIFKKGYTFKYVPKFLVNYYCHDSNIYYGDTMKESFKISFYNLCYKHIDLFKINSPYNLGLANFYKNNKKKAIRYFIFSLIYYKSNIKERMKSIGYTLTIIFPSKENEMKKIWKFLNKKI